jgi:hypothetical protein
MDDAFGVCGRQRGRQLETDADDTIDWHLSALEPPGEALSLDVLHDDERAFAVFDDVVNRRDVGVRDTCGGARFADDLRATSIRVCVSG